MVLIDVEYTDGRQVEMVASEAIAAAIVRAMERNEIKAVKEIGKLEVICELA